MEYPVYERELYCNLLLIVQYVAMYLLSGKCNVIFVSDFLLLLSNFDVCYVDSVKDFPLEVTEILFALTEFLDVCLLTFDLKSSMNTAFTTCSAFTTRTQL